MSEGNYFTNIIVMAKHLLEMLCFACKCLRNRLRNRESSAVAEEAGCILGKIYFF
jgi:hypothetical protein